MYVEQLKTGRWAVCEEDSSIVATHASKSAATKHMNEIKKAERFDKQYEEDEMFFHVFRD